MKTKLILLAAMLVCTACRNITYIGPNGARFTSNSFGNRTTIGELSINLDGTATLRNYNNDQVAALQAAFAAGLSAAKAGAIP